MFGGWFDNKFGPIGIDMGSHSIRAMQLERTLSGTRVHAAASASLPADLPAGPARIDLLAPVLKRLLTSAPFKGRRVVTCLPATSVQYKSMRVPPMPAAELMAAVQWEAIDRMRLPAEGASIQFFDAGQVRQGDETREEVIVMAALPEVVRDHMELLKLCKLQPEAIDAVPGALARAFAGADQGKSDCPAQLIVDIGSSSSKVLVTRGGQVVFFKLVDLGGRKFDQATAEHLKIPLPEAIELRRSLSSNATSDASTTSERSDSIRRNVGESVRNIAVDLGKEIALCLRYYSVTFRGGKPETLQLAGGEAHNDLISKVLSDEVAIPVEPARPLVGIELTNSSLNPEASHSEWAVAAGLSLRQETPARLRGAA